MANIENRRIKRRLMRIAAIAGAALILCAAVLAAVLLPKACSKGGEGKSASNTPMPTAAVTPADTPPAYTAEPAENASETAASVSTPAPTVKATVTPSALSTAEAEPRQSTDERSLALFNVSADTAYSSAGERLMTVSGCCSMQFINNTDSALYSAPVDAFGLDVVCASINGAAARFYRDESGVYRFPFGNTLAPGEMAELYFEFEGRVLSGELTLPSIAYETVYDVVCFASSADRLGFSAGNATALESAHGYQYRLQADGAEVVRLFFVEE